MQGQLSIEILQGVWPDSAGSTMQLDPVIGLPEATPELSRHRTLLHDQGIHARKNPVRGSMLPADGRRPAPGNPQKLGLRRFSVRAKPAQNFAVYAGNPQL